MWKTFDSRPFFFLSLRSLPFFCFHRPIRVNVKAPYAEVSARHHNEINSLGCTSDHLHHVHSSRMLRWAVLWRAQCDGPLYAHAHAVIFHSIYGIYGCNIAVARTKNSTSANTCLHGQSMAFSPFNKHSQHWNHFVRSNYVKVGFCIGATYSPTFYCMRICSGILSLKIINQLWQYICRIK